jgi:hypothetical protein
VKRNSLQIQRSIMRPSEHSINRGWVSPVHAITKKYNYFRKGNAMAKSWTDKDERQYEHIVKSERDQSRSAEREKEIAAATVNKRRAKEGSS